MKKLLSFFLFVAINFPFLALHAQGYKVKRFGIENGLYSNNVQAVIQDSDGYLWIPDEHGLTRYDGLSFKRFGCDTLKDDIETENPTFFVDENNNIEINAQLGSIVFNKKKSHFEYSRYYFKKNDTISSYVDTNGVPNGFSISLEMSKWGIWYMHGKHNYLFDGKSVLNKDWQGFNFKKEYNRSPINDNKLGFWIVTKTVFYRYNGHSFEKYATKNKGEYLTNIFIDSKNNVWCSWTKEGNVDKFLNVYRNGRKIFTLDSVKYSSFSGGICEDKLGNIWLGFEKGVVRYDGKTTSLAFPDVKDITSIICAPNDNLVFSSTPQGGSPVVFMKSGETIEEIQLPLSKKINTITADREGGVWLATTNGLLKIEPTNFIKYSCPKFSSDANGSKICYVDRENRTWIYKAYNWNRKDELLIEINGMQKTIADLTKLSEINIEEDEKGVVWIISQNNLLFDENGNKISGTTTERHLWKYEHYKLTEIANKMNLDNKYDLYVDHKNRCWLFPQYSNEDTKNKTAPFLFPVIINDGKEKPIQFQDTIIKEHNFKDKKNTDNQVVYFHAEDSTGNVYFAFISPDSTGMEIFKFNENKLLFEKYIFLPHDKYHINGIWNKSFKVGSGDKILIKYAYEPNAGDRLLIISPDESVEMIKLNTKHKSLFCSDDSSALYESAVMDNRNNIWVNGLGGVIYLLPAPSYYSSKAKAFSVGLTSIQIFGEGMYYDKSNNLWIIHSNELDKIDLDSYYASSNFYYKRYMANEITGGAEFDLFDVSEDKNNLLLLDGEGNYYKISKGKSEIKNETPPLLHIDSITWTDGGIRHYISNVTSTIELPYNFNPLVIGFTAVCLTDGSKVKYKYFLKGFDNHPQEQAERVVKYSSLPPGNYTFELMACNNDGVWTNRSIHLLFKVLPPWYRTWWAYSLYFIVFGGCIYGFITWRTRKLKAEKQKLEKVVTDRTAEVVKQKHLVEEKNKDILDSIMYAKRLQDAILPPMSIIKKYLPESFVLYKPKDIVAGDFYWMEKAGDSILIAACDCTGHGVPGAMVSVVCSNALNRTVKEFKITEPGKILDKVRELVLETFEKSESEVKDGMDISLCCINTATKEIQWSGAYNPLWYIQNSELKELAPDKQPIGKHENTKPFSTHTLKLNKGDILYLFTDGYADQFGGPKGKKFKYRQLQEKLSELISKPMEEQKKMLESTLDGWKGSLEQVDDVLLIGIRV